MTNTVDELREELCKARLEVAEVALQGLRTIAAVATLRRDAPERAHTSCWIEGNPACIGLYVTQDVRGRLAVLQLSTNAAVDWRQATDFRVVRYFGFNLP